MTRTKTLSIDLHLTSRLAFIAAFALLAFGFSSLTAYADHPNSAVSAKDVPGHSSDRNNKAGFTETKSAASATAGAKGRSAFGQNDLDNIMNRIADLESKKNELLKKLSDRQGKASSTASSTKDKENKDNSGHGNWKDRFCKDGAGSNLSSDVRERLCDRWKPATSTPDTRPKCPHPLVASSGSRDGKCERASSTPMIKLQHPNAGTAYKHPIDGAVLIKWHNTTSDKTVDIDLKKGSTTTSIAKNVTGKRIDDEGHVLGVSNASASMSSDSSHNNGSSRFDSHGASVSAKGSVSNNSQVYGYRWKDAPVGDGYQIVVTVKVGDTTYTDESDKAFSVKKNPKGMNWYDSDAATNGDVLGASTTAEMQTDVVLDHLVDILAEMSVSLSAQ